MEEIPSSWKEKDKKKSGEEKNNKGKNKVRHTHGGVWGWE